jgi:hypothetical protein
MMNKIRVWPLIALVYASLAVAILTPSCISQESREEFCKEDVNRAYMQGYMQGYNAAKQEYLKINTRLEEANKRAEAENKELKETILNLETRKFELEHILLPNKP